MPTLEQLLGPAPIDSQRCWVRMVAVSTVHGASAVSGNSQAMGNDLDAQLLLALREWADVVLVGADTVRAEDYGGVAPTPARPQPAPIAVLSASLQFDTESRFFTEAITPPLIMCPTASISDDALAPRREQLIAAGAELVDCGEATMPEVVAAVHARGYSRISCEGGPGVYSAMIDADLIDQVYLTLDPHIGSHVEAALVRTTGDEPNTTVHRLTLEAVHPHPDSTVFLRYGRGCAL